MTVALFCAITAIQEEEGADDKLHAMPHLDIIRIDKYSLLH